MVIVSRRTLIKTAGIGALAVIGSSAKSGISAKSTLLTRFPDRTNFPTNGTHLDAAYTHLVGQDAVAAGRIFLEKSSRDYSLRLPHDNPRGAAVSAFARLINASPSAVAIVPSTMEGEQLVGEAIGLGAGVGVVSDALHYADSLVAWGEKAKRGLPFKVLRPKSWRIDYDELARAITSDIRLVVVSSVSSSTGYRHDLAKVCEIAHAKKALVYADIIQEVGAIPFDVQASGVDFACAGGYKWLMGIGGAAFLYVRPDRLDSLRPTRMGWRGVEHYQSHFLPNDTPGAAEGNWTLGTSTSERIEVSTPSWISLAVTTAGMSYVSRAGVERLTAHRQPMLERMQQDLPRSGWQPLTPLDAMGPSVVFALPGAQQKYAARLNAARIRVSIYPDRVRISPSVYNDMNDIEHLLSILTTQA